MMPVPRSLIFQFVLPCLLLGAIGSSWAQEATGGILVLGVADGQRQNNQLTESLERYLGSTERIISSRQLSAEERKCREPRCLYSLAQSKGASILIGASVMPISSKEVELGVYLLLCASKTWRHTETTIAPEQVMERLNQLTRKLLSGPVGERPRSGLSSYRPKSERNVMDKLIEIQNALPPPRRISAETERRLGISLLAFGGLALGTGVLISVLGSQYNTPERCFGGFSSACIDRGTPLAIASYATAGGLALAGTLTLAIPNRKKDKR